MLGWIQAAMQQNTIVHGITIKTTSAEHGQNMFYPYSALVVFMVIPCTVFSCSWLVDARICFSEKDLPVDINKPLVAQLEFWNGILEFSAMGFQRVREFE